ncbi:serine hydrolase domain-containing protein [Arenibacter lacus]|uniref:serine hydrolase domain-containing protein n=1 Tax=Arenibacter lacus TaxID=2608629 RepID=UPI00123D70F7|nr:serine hydrolase [Arenibacter lacus]
MGQKKSIVLFILLALALVYIASSTESYYGRYIKWRASDIEDHQKFPKYSFKAASNPFYFPSKIDSNLNHLMVSIKEGKQQKLLPLLKKTGTTAFIIIKNDTILYEQYLNGYRRNSINTSFSIAKSITSLLTGIAIDDGFINDVKDPVGYYIPGLLQTDTNYSDLLISQLLEMQSGIQFKDHDLPWGDKPKAYYHPQLRERVLELPLEYDPGSRFKYNSYNPILLGMILESVTHLPAAKYFEENLWNELGMEYAGSWSMDSERSGMTKMESGLNIRAIDFAKFGRLVLNDGRWNNKQLISKEWMDYSFDISEEYQLSDFSADLYYRNFWWIYADKTQSGFTINSIAGTGHLGQFLFVFPTEKVIVVRMGKELGKVDSWRSIFQEIVEHIIAARS